MASDLEYYYTRAEQELVMAQRSCVPEAVKVHCALADRYLRLVDHAAAADGVSDGDARR